jgi:recombination protein RecT
VAEHLQRFIPLDMPKNLILTWAFFLLRRTPKLMDCSPDSFAAALLRCHSLNLDPLVPNVCWVIPRKGVATFQFGYLGLRDLAMRSGKYRNVVAHCVYEGDDFGLEYVTGQIHHRPALKGRGELLCVYAVAVYPDGYADPELMTLDQVRAIQRRSAGVQSGKSSPWDSDWDEMARKTVLKRLCKRLDLSVDVATALADEDADPVDATTSTPVNLDALPKIAKATPALPADEPPVEDAIEEPASDLDKIPSFGPTSIMKCKAKGIYTQRALWDSISSKTWKPGGMRTPSLDYLRATFADPVPDEALEPEPVAPQENGNPRTGPLAAGSAMAELTARILEGVKGGMLEPDVIQADLIDSGLDDTAADKLIGRMVEELGIQHGTATPIAWAKVWQACKAELAK